MEASGQCSTDAAGGPSAACAAPWLLGPSPQEGGEEGELLCTFQVTAALRKRCQPPTKPGKSTEHKRLPSLATSWANSSAALSGKEVRLSPPAWGLALSSYPPTEGAGAHFLRRAHTGLLSQRL